MLYKLMFEFSLPSNSGKQLRIGNPNIKELRSMLVYETCGYNVATLLCNVLSFHGLYLLTVSKKEHDYMMDELSAPLKDVLEKSRTMLNRCTDLCERSSPKCTCKSVLETAQKGAIHHEHLRRINLMKRSLNARGMLFRCCRRVMSSSEIEELQSSCTILETKTRQQKAATKEVTRTIKELKVKIETLLKQTVLDDDKCEEEQYVTIKEVPAVISSNRQVKLEVNQDVKLTESHIKETKPIVSSSQPKRDARDVVSSTSKTRDDRKLQIEVTTETGLDKVDVVKQERMCVPYGEVYWRDVSQRELEESRTIFFELEGVHTVLCLDISESMVRNDGWQQASMFVNDYLQGLKEIASTRGITNEHVALVTFGHETVVKQRYSNKYDELLKVFNNLKLGGPSPLFGGMLMSLAAAWCSRHHSIQVGLGTHVWTRIVIISDGRPTDTKLIAGLDSDSPEDIEGTTNLIYQEMEHYRRERFDVFFVPVGHSDKPFFDVMLGISDGIMLDHESGMRLAKRHYLSTKILDAFGLTPIYMQFASLMDSDEMTEEDMADIKSIQERTKSRVFGGSEMDIRGLRQDHYNERQRTTLPTIGSRVRRGPDWQWKQQDSSGPGTVIGHHPTDDQVWVEWDADKHQNVYRYGNDNYDVIIVDEPRKVSDKHLLAVGCSVIPGVKWKLSEPRQKSGIVIKLDKKQNNATVRWDNGRRGEYSYDAMNEEIVYNPPFEPFYSKGHTLGYTADDPTDEADTKTHRTKNKNAFPK